MKVKLLTVFVFLCMILIIFNSPSYTKVLATVAGTVKSENDKPIPGARVIIVSGEDKSKHEVITDKKGRWRKVNLRPGPYTIGFMADGYQPDNVNVLLSAIKKNPPVDIKLKPVPEAPLAKGDALYKEKKYDEALKEYQRVLSEKKELIQLYEKIGLCYYKLDDLDNAVEAFKLMLEKDPKSKNSLINLSAIYLGKGELKEGMKYFEQLDEETLKDPNLFYNMGVLLFEKQQTDLAIENFIKCISRDPKHIDGYYQLAIAYINKGNMEKAKTYLNKVIEIAPESEQAAQAKNMLKVL